MGLNTGRTLKLSWGVAFLDSIMPVNVRLFFPFSEQNLFSQLISTGMLHIVCLVFGVFSLWHVWSRALIHSFEVSKETVLVTNIILPCFNFCHYGNQNKLAYK